MKLYYDAAYGLLFICAGLGIGYFDAYEIAKRSGKSVTQMNMAEDMERRIK